MSRIVVGVSGSLASLAALRQAAALARREGAGLLAVLAWEPPEGEALYARMPDRAWARMWADDARSRLARAFEDGLGGVPEAMAVERRIVRDAPAAALVAAADEPGDVLVIGCARAHGRFGRPRRRPVLRAVMARAEGPVVVVPGPVLRRGEARLLRRHAPDPVPGWRSTEAGAARPGGGRLPRTPGRGVQAGG
ncbi:universal stress protein [Streptomyces sp. NPDC053431]|uniref:universal stress protein n=1 Tax=Streptomyces sp. NPDC053431 TaxID=3365703 RepID=UPI0037CD7AB7